jgi:hypothetical protein
MSPTLSDFEESSGEINLERAEATLTFCDEIESQITEQIILQLFEIPRDKLDINDETIKSEYKQFFTFLLNPEIDENCPFETVTIDRIDLLPKHRVYGQNHSLDLDLLLTELPENVDPSYSEGKIIKLEREENEDVFVRELSPERYRYSFILNQRKLLDKIDTPKLDRFYDALEIIDSITKEE